MRKRKFGKYGNTDVIKLKPSDKEDLGFDYEDEVDLEDVVIIKRRKKK